MTIESVAATEPRLDLADRLQPVLLLAAIGTGLILGRVTPGIADAASNLVSVGVFVLIALVMLNVDPRNVATTFTHRRFLTSAIALNFVVNPIIAWTLGSVFLSGEPDLRIGLILFLVTPCIGWYLIFSALAGGDTELGVGLLGINVILQVLLLPLYLALFVGDTATISIATILQSIGLYLLLPAVIAGVIRRWWSRQDRLADEQQRYHVPALTTITLAAVIIAMFASHADAIFDELVALTVALGPVIELPLLIIMTRLRQRAALREARGESR